jgi:hypothetical protein
MKALPCSYGIRGSRLKFQIEAGGNRCALAVTVGPGVVPAVFRARVKALVAFMTSASPPCGYNGGPTEGERPQAWRKAS